MLVAIGKIPTAPKDRDQNEVDSTLSITFHDYTSKYAKLENGKGVGIGVMAYLTFGIMSTFSS